MLMPAKKWLKSFTDTTIAINRSSQRIKKSRQSRLMHTGSAQAKRTAET
jgi:hypothetical protein